MNIIYLNGIFLLLNIYLFWCKITYKKLCLCMNENILLAQKFYVNMFR